MTLRALFSNRVGCRFGAAAVLGMLDKYACCVLLAVSCLQGCSVGVVFR
jgi:hypothetical protein